MGTPVTSVPPAQFRSLWTSQVYWYVLALAFVFGFFYNFLPVSFPAFRQTFSPNLEQLGRTQFLFAVGGLGLCLFGAWIFGRLGLGRGAVAAVVALVVSLAVIGGAPAFLVVLAGAACLGIAINANYIVSCAIINDCFPEKRQSAFFAYGVFDAIGATAGPAALGWWIARAERTGESWRIGYGACAGLLMILVLWGLVVKRRIKPIGAAASSTPTAALPAMRGILTQPAIYGIGLAFLLHGLAQCGMVSWVGQLYQKKLSVDAARAALLISFNSAGFFAGRSLLSWVTARWRIADLVLLGSCALGGTLAYASTLMMPSYVAGVMMFTLAGVFISGDGPAINSFTGVRFEGQSAAAFPLMIAFGSIGSAVGPYVTGALGQEFGLERGIWLLPLFSLGLAALSFGWFFIDRKRRRTQSPA